mmetsp:Transcript_34979/g.73788  ORF Transcript_34979/g.73788 Transcript_34979/m.73788 type:complete len:97 (+) Transcript_34979:243-533(+)
MTRNPRRRLLSCQTLQFSVTFFPSTRQSSVAAITSSLCLSVKMPGFENALVNKEQDKKVRNILLFYYPTPHLLSPSLRSSTYRGGGRKDRHWVVCQ